MTSLPPLRFRPILREYIWGGRKLGTVLGKAIGSSEHYAESWEVVDHGDDQSVVDGGPLEGTKLHDLVTRENAALFGRHQPQQQFPLLFKLLDCNETLSVQVHPNDEQAAKLDPPDLGKTEAWVVLAAEPGSKIYAGLKPGVDKSALEQAITIGRCEECLNTFEPRVGDCVYIEAGSVHALGAGLLIAEIQQSSNTTYRLFDWNRADRDGRSRPLHIHEALSVINFQRGPVAPLSPTPTDHPHIDRLVTSDKFILNRWDLKRDENLLNDNQFHILAVMEGSLRIVSRDIDSQLARGDTLLIPASWADLKLEPQDHATILEMHLP